MAISAEDVKRLRDTTGVGMMDCKKALQEADGDFDKAIELLRKKGEKVARKRAEREAKEGVVMTATTDDRKVAAVVEVNCETDFVARNEAFQGFAERVTNRVLEARPASQDDMLALDLDGQTIQEAVVEQTGKIGEKIDVRRFAIIETEGEVIDYVHPGSRLGVLVEMTTEGAEDAGRDVAMQVAALNPVATTIDEVPEKVRQDELEIGREQALNEGKPENIVDRIAEGKLKRYYKDNVLVEQPFVKDASMTVGEMLKKADTNVKRYVRFALGE
jgi:elongation factor Ts